MINNSAKAVARKLLLKNELYSLSDYNNLKRIIESNQFTIIEYKKYNNSEYVLTLIKKLGVECETQKNDAFLYVKNNLKLLFINSDISDEDKCSLLRHELGHICDPAFKNISHNDSKIKLEEFANEFSYFAKNPGICFIISVFLKKKRKLLVSLALLAACIFVFAFKINTLTYPQLKRTSGDSLDHKISDGTYYVTSAGRKYHKKNCIIIKYKNNLTEIKLNDAICNLYKPCMICNPE